MFTAISTACLYPAQLDESFSTLISMGFRNFEVFINTFSEFGEEYLKKMKRTADDSGCRILSVHPFTSGYENMLLFSDYKTRFFDSLEFYRNFLNACAVLGAKTLVLHGRRSDRSTISDEEYFDRYVRLYRLGKEYGVSVGQENVNQFSSGAPAFIRKMKAACGSECAFVLDLKQAVRCGADPCDFCSAMSGHIRQVHFNDSDASSDCRLPGRGTLDYGRFLSELKKAGYDGSLTIEVYRKASGN